MNRGALFALLVAGSVGLSACGGGSAVSTESDAEARIASGPAINASTADYRVGNVDVRLVKVVRLPSEMIGIQFTMHPGSRSVQGCCTLFPRLALTGSQPVGESGNVRRVYVVEAPSSFSPGGTFHATNSANSRSRNGTRTSTEHAMLILSL